MLHGLIIAVFLAISLALPMPAGAFDRSRPGLSGAEVQSLSPMGRHGNVISAQRNKRRDHDRARDAVSAGDVLPLQQIMRQIGRSHPGRLLDANLARDGQGRWIYHLKLLSRGDRVQRLVVDARSGRVLQGGRRR